MFKHFLILFICYSKVYSQISNTSSSTVESHEIIVYYEPHNITSFEIECIIMSGYSVFSGLYVNDSLADSSIYTFEQSDKVMLITINEPKPYTYYNGKFNIFSGVSKIKHTPKVKAINSELNTNYVFVPIDKKIENMNSNNKNKIAYLSMEEESNLNTNFQLIKEYNLL